MPESWSVKLLDHGLVVAFMFGFGEDATPVPPAQLPFFGELKGIFLHKTRVVDPITGIPSWSVKKMWFDMEPCENSQFKDMLLKYLNSETLK
jgi:hypothetical protein